MEDYWEKKLNDERTFYEEQLKMSETQFKELEHRLKEYDEVLMKTSDSKDVQDVDDDKLSTIEETFSLECQISDWEEEILNLKNELKEKETIHKNDVLKMNTIYEIKIKEKETEAQLYKNKLADLQMSINQSQTESQTDSDKLWERAKSYKDITNHQTSNSASTGPQSLPCELVSEAHREVRRLQQLRRHIQEECDHLLLRKISLEEAERRKDCVTETLECKTRSSDKMIINSINQKLSQQSAKCHLLQDAMKLQKNSFEKLLSQINNQHKQQISEYESLIKSGQDINRKYIQKNQEQVEKLVLSENVIEQLVSENETLVIQLELLTNK